jgi:hypothetical protein
MHAQHSSLGGVQIDITLPLHGADQT